MYNKGLKNTHANDTHIHTGMDINVWTKKEIKCGTRNT